jgi:tetratricopeptide (TPR) repeat protein
MHGGESPTSRFSAIPESNAALAEIVMSSDRLSSARRLDAVLTDREYNRGNPANRRLGPVMALALAGRIIDARRKLDEFEKSSDRDVLVARYPELSLTQGVIALAGGEYERSIDFFRAASSSFSFGYDACRVCALPWLGRAYESAGRNDSAVVVYERYLATGDPDRGGTDGLWLAVTFRQLGILYAQRGDTAKAIRRLEEFVTLWSGADPVLQPQVSAARKRIADLRPVRVAGIESNN